MLNGSSWGSPLASWDFAFQTFRIIAAPGTTTHLDVAGYTDPTVAGASHSFTVTAKDDSGATMTGYTGTVHFTSSDSGAVLPGNYAFVAGDNGVHTFSATLNTIGEQSITATDTVNAAISGTQSSITVQAPNHTVTFNAHGGTGTMTPQTTNVSTALTANAFTRTGYNFSGWNTVAGGGGTAYADGATYSFAADVTLYAQWTVASYTVTFNNNGGTGVVPTSESVAYGALVTAPTTAPTYTGHTLNGWYTASTGGTQWNFATNTMGAGAMTLFAQWTVASYTVTFNNNGGTGVVPTSESVAYGALVTAPTTAPTYTGHTLNGWYTASTGGTQWNFATNTMGAGAMTLFAQWTVASYTVTFNNNGGTGVVPTSESVAYGALVTAPTTAPTYTGHTLNGWYTASTGGAQWNFATSHMGAGAMTLFAQWTVTSYTVTFNNNGGTGVVPTSESVAYGALVTAPTTAPTYTGHTLNGWYTASTGGTQWNFATNTMGAGAMTLFAQWTVASYTVTFDNNGGTGVVPTSESVAYGALVTAPTTAPTYTGHTLNGWYTASTGGAQWNFATSHMGAGAMTLFAQWTVASYTVTFDNNGGTGVVPTSESVAYGALVTAPTTAPTYTGHTLNGWYTASTGGTQWNFTTDTMGAGAMTLFAQWTALPNHTVTFDAHGGTGTMTPQVANVPTALTANTFTLSGYNFSGWNTVADGRRHRLCQ